MSSLRLIPTAAASTLPVDVPQIKSKSSCICNNATPCRAVQRTALQSDAVVCDAVPAHRAHAQTIYIYVRNERTVAATAAQRSAAQRSEVKAFAFLPVSASIRLSTSSETSPRI